MNFTNPYPDNPNVNLLPEPTPKGAGEFIGNMVMAGLLFTFVLMFLDERVRPETKDWWFMK